MNEETKKKWIAWMAIAKEKAIALFELLKRTIGPAASWCRRKILALWASGLKGKVICVGTAAILAVCLVVGSCGKNAKDNGKGQTVTEYRDELLEKMREDLQNPDSDFITGFKENHAPSITITSAKVLDYKVTTKDGSQYVGADEENIKSGDLILRFKWEGLTGPGQTDVHLLYDGETDEYDEDCEWTTQDIREILMYTFNTDLEDPDHEWRKHIESAHVTVTVKSADVINCEVTTRDGSNRTGKDFDNIISFSMLIRFAWNGWTESGYTDLRFEYDWINSRPDIHIEYTTAKINKADPEFWSNMAKKAGSAISTAVEVYNAVDTVSAFF